MNLYGPRDNFDLETGHVIPALDPQVRLGADPVNLGSGVEISMRDLAELIARHVGYDGIQRTVEWWESVGRLAAP